MSNERHLYKDRRLETFPRAHEAFTAKGCVVEADENQLRSDGGLVSTLHLSVGSGNTNDGDKVLRENHQSGSVTENPGVKNNPMKLQSSTVSSSRIRYCTAIFGSWGQYCIKSRLNAIIYVDSTSKVIY